MTKVKLGDIVRHNGGGRYPQLKGHYGLVQTIDMCLGVEWDDLAGVTFLWPLPWPLHDLKGLLTGRRAMSGWYVSSSDIEVL